MTLFDRLLRAGSTSPTETGRLAAAGLEAELRTAADALERAAFVLRDRAGQGAAAGAAMQAAMRARRAAGDDQ